MTTLNELYPTIDLNHQIVYRTDRSLLGKTGDIIYLINKSDNAVIVMDSKRPNNMGITVFNDNVLVNSFDVKHLFISQSTSYTPEGIERDRWKMYIDFLEPYYLNDCAIHLGTAINDQVNHYMKSVAHFNVRLNFLQEHGQKILNTIEIEDKVYNFTYKAIVRDGLVYFTMMFNDDPDREEFVRSKFNLQEYTHYESAGGYIIDSFAGDWFIAETHYDPYLHLYQYKTARYENSTVLKEIDLLKEHQEYDVNFIFNFIYNSVIIYHPKYSFLEKLVELSILTDGEKLTHEHMKIYDMATI